MAILKKEKQEKVALNLQNPVNRKAAIQASLDCKIPLVYKGDGIFLINVKHSKQEKVLDFFKQFISQSVNCIQGGIFREDPKCDYLVIFDIDKKED